MSVLDSAKDFLRKRSICKHRSTVPTGILPMNELHSAVVFIDVEDPSFHECRNSITDFFKENGLKGDIFFFDFRKINADQLLITSIQTTILKKDINWYGKPTQGRISLMTENDPDVFISLINNTGFPIEYIAACSRAKFKIGRRQVPGNIFDLVISDPADSPLTALESFSAIQEYLNKIN